MSQNTQNPETESVDTKATAEATAPTEKTAEQVLTEKLAESDQKYKYLYADFENFKKRAIRERQDAAKFGLENVITDLLAVLDNLDRALQYAKPETDANLLSGLKMVAQQFKASIEKQGVAEIASIDQVFNPELHEAVGQTPNEKPANTIIQEMQKGYTLNGRLLRASRVMLSSGPASN